MDIYKGKKIVDFAGRFQSDLDCKKNLSEVNWSSGYTCRKCGHSGRSYGVKKKKVVCAVQLTKEGKVKQLYGLQIIDFPAKSLRLIFDHHLAKEAEVTTDGWKGYNPKAKGYNINQIPSDFGQNFKVLQTAIH